MPCVDSCHVLTGSTRLRPSVFRQVPRTFFGTLGGTQFVAITLAVFGNQLLFGDGRWTETEGKIKQQWGQLSDNDLAQINGRRDQLEGKIQQRYGLAKDRVRKDADDLVGRSVLVMVTG